MLKMYNSIFIIFLLILFSCNKDNITEPDPANEEYTIQTEDVAGYVELPPNSSLKQENITLITPAVSKSNLSESNFSIKTMESKRPQIICALNKNDEPVLLAPITEANKQNFEVSANSTALALILMNPVFILTDTEQRENILAKAEASSSFASLVADIEKLLENDPDNVLNYNLHPGIYKEAALISLDILKNGQTSFLKKRIDITAIDPWIDNAGGDSIAFYNPKTIYYAAGISPTDKSEQEEIVTVEAKDGIVSYQFGWPPIYKTPTTRTGYLLGNGSYQVRMTKGFDFSQTDFFNPNTINGRATLYNSGKAFKLLFDLVIGDLIPTKSLAKLALNSSKNYALGVQMAAHISNKDGFGLLYDFVKLIIENTDEICYWLWQDFSSDAGLKYITKIHQVLGNVAMVVKVVSIAETALNDVIPFAYDIYSGDRQLSFVVNQQNGELTSNIVNSSPLKPHIYCAKSSANQNTNLSFQVTTTDPEGGNISYRIHWGDGTLTDWSDFIESGSTLYVQKSYSEIGNYKIHVEAKDGLNGISELSDPFTINIYSEGTYFYYNFDSDFVGLLPSAPPWETRQTEPSYLTITDEQHYGSSGNSCVFIDYDPSLDTSATNAASLLTYLDCPDEGVVEFSWNISSAKDNFGVRIWENDNYNWDKIGYYVLFYDGKMSYYDNGFHQLLDSSHETWYNMKLKYSISQQKYDIYINGSIRKSDIPFVGAPNKLTLFQVVAFSDATCKKAFIDEIKMSVNKSMKKRFINTEKIPSRAFRLESK